MGNHQSNRISPNGHPRAVKMGGGVKIPYPKHVWSPAGGWYAQPANWRMNTMIAGATMFSIVAVAWNFSAGRETWARKPEDGTRAGTGRKICKSTTRRTERLKRRRNRRL